MPFLQITPGPPLPLPWTLLPYFLECGWHLHYIFNPFESLHFFPLCHRPGKKSPSLDLIICSSVAELSSQPPRLKILEPSSSSMSTMQGLFLKSHPVTCADQTLFSSEQLLLLFFPNVSSFQVANLLLPSGSFPHCPQQLTNLHHHLTKPPESPSIEGSQQDRVTQSSASGAQGTDPEARGHHCTAVCLSLPAPATGQMILSPSEGCYEDRIS